MNPESFLLTPDLPGCKGRLKDQPEDFEVDEVPAYEPSGSGEHLFLWIEKRDMGAEYFVRQVAARLGISPREIGTAGLKDRRAVTRQFLSVPATAEGALARLDGDGIRLLRHARHGNKLRPGHSHGNRFRILIRDADAAVKQSVEETLERLQTRGMPNYYGPQRFGRDGETSRIGMALLKQEPIPTGADGRRANTRNFFMRKLYLSAAQSLLFNEYLARRMRDGLFRTAIEGDVMAKYPFGGMFVTQDVAVEQERIEKREIVPTGPMFGRKTFPAAGKAAEREAEILADAGMTSRSFDGFGKLLPGTRRHNLIYPLELQWNWEPEGLRLSFGLPAGSYATILLAEVMKCPLEAETSEPDTAE